VIRHNGKSPSPGASKVVRVWRGEARVWFYRNESSIDVYVKPVQRNQQSSGAGPAPICFRISARDFVGR
jgi:hypothetical protein